MYKHVPLTEKGQKLLQVMTKTGFDFYPSTAREIKTPFGNGVLVETKKLVLLGINQVPWRVSEIPFRNYTAVDGKVKIAASTGVLSIDPSDALRLEGNARVYNVDEITTIASLSEDNKRRILGASIEVLMEMLVRGSPIVRNGKVIRINVDSYEELPSLGDRRVFLVNSKGATDMPVSHIFTYCTDIEEILGHISELAKDRTKKLGDLAPLLGSTQRIHMAGFEDFTFDVYHLTDMKQVRKTEAKPRTVEIPAGIGSVISETMLLFTAKLLVLKGNAVEGDHTLGDTLGVPIIKLKTITRHGLTEAQLKGAVIREFRTGNGNDFFVIENGPAERLFESMVLVGQALGGTETKVKVRFERGGKQVEAWIVPAKVRLTDLDC